jgi:hypothetical protein
MAIQTDNCWFCGKHPQTHTYFVTMTKKEWISATRFTILEKTIPIPRCDRCQSTKRRLMILIWLTVGIPGAGLIALLQWPGIASLVALIVSILVGIVLLGMTISTTLAHRFKGIGYHPDVKASMKEGYAPLNQTDQSRM